MREYEYTINTHSPAEALRDRDLEAGGSSTGGAGAARVNPAASSAFACKIKQTLVHEVQFRL